MDGGDAAPREQAHVLLTQVAAVRCGGRRGKQPVAVEKLRLRQTRAVEAVRLRGGCLREMQLHSKPVFQRVAADGLPRRMGRGVIRVDGAVDLDAAVVKAVPALVKRRGLETVGIGVKVKAVGQLRRDGVAEICLDTAFRDGLRLGVGEKVHLTDRGNAEAQALRDAQKRRGLDAPRVHPRLTRKNAPAQPLVLRKLVAVAAQQRQRQMRVAVDKTRHQNHAGGVNDVLRLLLRGFFPEIGDLPVRDADKGVEPDGHPFVHGEDGNVRE